MGGEDTIEIRGRILRAFECAERESDAAERRAWLTFANDTLRNDFRHISPADSAILRMEGGGRELPSFPPDISAKPKRALAALGFAPERIRR